jgi:glucose/arabinose dehydrogenase
MPTVPGVGINGSRAVRASCHWRPAVLGMLLLGVVAGCAPRTVRIDPERMLIDRSAVEYPSGYELRVFMRDLTAPTAIAFDDDGTMFIAEGGIGGHSPRVFGYREEDGAVINIYPTGRQIPFGLLHRGFRMRGPIGGMLVHERTVYVSHRDGSGRGMISAFEYDGTRRTVIADLPAQGDHGVTDLVIGPNGRLYFGVGTATNSGVVGIDNWHWVRRHPGVADEPYVDVRLLGYRYDTPNPRAGLFGGGEIAVTAPFQPFGTSNQTRVRAARDGKPNGAIYSVHPMGGDLRVEAHGLRHPRGLAFNEYGRLYMTNQGMELRGTRPVKDDPDVLLRLVVGAWYGWPDYSADMLPISEPRFQPPLEMILRTGYPELSFLIDHGSSGLLRPDRNTLLQASFPSLSGAAKLAFAPVTGPFSEYRGNAIVALSGDRAPFATSGYPLLAPVGFKIVRVDVDTRQVYDFVHNTRGIPASLQQARSDALERPIALRFAPDGSLYIVDMGRLEMRRSRPNIPPRGGRILKLIPIEEHQTRQVAGSS